jgi:aflatoxin B1 aldehyde reductase
MKVILGTMNMGAQDDSGLFASRITEQSAVEQVLQKFADLGASEIDTARVYLGGNTEIALGKAESCKRFIVATKVFPCPPGMAGVADDAKGLEARSVAQQVEASLAALRTDKLDILYLHWPDPNTDLEETLQTIDKIHQRGSFVEFGLSNFPAFQVVEIWHYCRSKGYVLPTVAQYPYNPLARTAEAELLPVCRRYGLRFYAFNPLGGGLLAGKYSNPEEDPDEGRFSTATGGVQAVRYRERYWNRLMFEGVAAIRVAADEHGKCTDHSCHVTVDSDLELASPQV